MDCLRLPVTPHGISEGDPGKLSSLVDHPPPRLTGHVCVLWVPHILADLHMCRRTKVLSSSLAADAPALTIAQ